MTVRMISVCASLVLGFVLLAPAPPPVPSVTVELVDRRTGGVRIALLLPAIQSAY